MLNVGENSYITIAEAEELLAGKALHTEFVALSSEVKEKLLIDAAMRIDSLIYSGRKRSVMQYMEFPRNTMNEVPYQVKYAQALEAVSVLDKDAESRRNLQEQGVTSVTLGKVSESYGNSTVKQKYRGLYNSEAFSLLRRYFAGSVPIV